MKRETLHISPNGDITIQRVYDEIAKTNITYSIYYKWSCESKLITPETYEKIVQVINEDKYRLSTIESIKEKGTNLTVLDFLLVPTQKVDNSMWGFDMFLERNFWTPKEQADFLSWLENLDKLEAVITKWIKSIENDPSIKASQEYLENFGKQFSLERNFQSNKWSDTSSWLPVSEEPSTESGVKNVTKEADTKESNVSNLEIEYFENKNPKTFWFNWIAWMSELKTELTGSFLKPLRFKFQVEWKLSNLAKDKKKENQYQEIYKQYEKFKISIPTWLLFYWPPGTWKTFITKKLAQELWAGLIVKSLWEFWSSYLHQTTVNIKNFFDWAKKASEKGPIILFLDEIDSLLSKRTNNIDANKAEEVSQFLQEFNKLEEAKNLIVIAATNRPDHLDPAILRSWRLDKKIYIGPPDYIARKELFQMYIEKEDRPHDKLDYDELAKLSEWYVAADIEAMCDEVSRDAGQNLLDLLDKVDSKKWISDKKLKETLDWQKITMDLLKQAIQDTHSSLKTTDMTIYDEWLKNLEK